MKMITNCKFYLALALFLVVCTNGMAQTKIELIDVLSPYNLSVTLLDNGDFSIRTAYGSAKAKHIIYEQDGTSTIPTNYTSHVHFKVDNVLFQLPFEEDTATRLPPPPHPLVVSAIFADTLGGTPRLNARMFGVMPDGDTMRFLVIFAPSKRASGGFIKVSALALNTTRQTRNVGSLFFFDTQIDTNDASPIATAFGYSEVETDFTRGVGLGMPEYWLAMEGTPRDPLLVARGNLKASGLIEPDYMIFGSWTDIGANPIFRGLNYVQWNERVASKLKYKDSGVLLRWEQAPVARDAVQIIAATEIGVIDSLQRFTGVGGGSGGGGGPDGDGIFGAGPGGCSSLALNIENPCGQPGYSPYAPDSVQLLYLLTNTDAQTLTNVTIQTNALPAGITSPNAPSTMIPADIVSGATGVGTLSIVAAPRLRDTSFRIPIQIHTTAGTAAVYDTLCLNVPGITPSVTINNIQFAPLCPGTYDSLDITLDVKGVRCMHVDSIAFLNAGSASDIKRFGLTQPFLDHLPGYSKTTVRVRYSPDVLDTQRVKVVVYSHEFETFNGKDTTFLAIRDTSIVTGVGKDAEFFLANATDTLNFGKVCVGDTSVSDWPILNKGGCEVLVDSAKIVGGPPGDFVLQNAAKFPISIPRAVKGSAGRATIKFSPSAPGLEQAKLVVWSIARPVSDTLAIRGIGDSPSFLIDRDTLSFDTICPGVRSAMGFTLKNPSVCTADIDSVTLSAAELGYTISPQGAFSVGGNNGTASPQVGANFNTLGDHFGTATVHSKLGNKEVVLHTVVATRTLSVGASVNYGDVLVGSNTLQHVTVTSNGSAGVVLNSIQLAGTNASEYAITAISPPLPAYLAPGATLGFDVTFTPAGVEQRSAQILFGLDPTKTCTSPPPLAILGRGIQPLIDVPRKLVDLGRVCVGDSITTTIAVRNFGNAPLQVTGIDRNGSTEFALSESLPITIDSAASHLLKLQFIPATLGPQTLSLHLASNGKWVTAPDTLITLQGTGILCGSISVDTIHATLGVPVSVPVRFSPRNANLNAAAVMNAASASVMDFSISHNPKILRFSQSILSGMISTATPTVSVAPSYVEVSSSGTLSTADNVVAVLQADPLLGDDFQTPLKLNVKSFAKGYSKIDVHDGLLFVEGCALDQRYISFAKGSYIVPSGTPVSKTGSLMLNVSAEVPVTVNVYDAIGRQVVRLVDQVMAKGLYQLSLANSHLASGIYFVSLVAGDQKQLVHFYVN